MTQEADQASRGLTTRATGCCTTCLERVHQRVVVQLQDGVITVCISMQFARAE